MGIASAKEVVQPVILTDEQYRQLAMKKVLPKLYFGLITFGYLSSYYFVYRYYGDTDHPGSSRAFPTVLCLLAWGWCIAYNFIATRLIVDMKKKWFVAKKKWIIAKWNQLFTWFGKKLFSGKQLN